MTTYVVIAQYNHVDYTVRAIASLEDQISYSNIIVVDGGSTEDVSSLMRLPIIFIQEHQNLGYGHLINVGIKQAEQYGADMVLTLNNDVIASVGMVQELINDVQVLNLRGVVSPTIYDRYGGIWFAGGRRSNFRGNVYHETSEHAEHLRNSTFLSGCAMMIPTYVIREVGYFDESYFMYYEDADFSSRCDALEIPLLTCNKAFLTHLVGASDSTGQVYYRYAPANRLRWVKRYSPPAWRPFVLIMVALNFLFKGLMMSLYGDRRSYVRLMWTGIFARFKKATTSGSERF